MESILYGFYHWAAGDLSTLTAIIFLDTLDNAFSDFSPGFALLDSFFANVTKTKGSFLKDWKDKRTL